MRIAFALAMLLLVLLPATSMGEGQKLWVHPYVCKGGFFGPLRDDYVEILTDASHWKTVLARTHAVGFHMALLGKHRDKVTGKTFDRATDEQLRALAAFYRRHNLKVNIEIGGVRFRPDMVKAGRSGVGRRYTREVQIPLLERWRKAGGSIDYLTTDHAVMMRMGEQKAGKTKDGVTYSLDELIQELSEALAELHGEFPDAEFGIAESLGHFRVKAPGGGRAYSGPHGVALSAFLQKLRASGDAAGVRIRNFMIDHQIQATHRDATGKIITAGGPFVLKREYVDRAAEIPVDLGRATAAAKMARAAGMRVVFLVTPGAYGFGLKDDSAARNDHRAAEAVRRMAKECAASDIRPDAISFECWQPHPSRTGPETGEHSFMHNVLGTIPAQAPSAMATTGRPPNIVLILVDDMGWKDLGCYGSTFYETPNIDKLAESGVRFTDAYAAAPLCSATRAAILTGWSPARQHLIGVTPHSREKYQGFKDYESWKDAPEYLFSKMPLRLSKQLGQLHPDRSMTIAERLKERGYATAFIGKWHLGPDADKFPEKHGFDINIAGSHYGWPHSYFSPYSIPNLTDGPEGEHVTDRLTDESLAWMEKQHKAKTPFFLYFSHFSVHGPWQSKDEYTEYFESKVDANDKQRNSVYAGMIKSLDDSVGRVMDRLTQLGIEKETLVILASDNGGIAMEKKCRVTGRVAPITSMHPLRGEKALLYEGGVRVPCIISMPGTVQTGATSDEPINSVDFYPTILDLAGLTKRAANPLDGQSLMAHVKSGAPLKRDQLTWFMPARIKAGEGIEPCASIRHGNYKYIKFFVGRRELYDLSQDIGETRNLAETKPALCEKLDAMLMADLKRKNAHIPIKNPTYEGAGAGDKVEPPKHARKPKATAGPRATVAGDFHVFNGRLAKEGELGYVLTADPGEIAWALRPIGIAKDVVQIRSAVRLRPTARTANAFLAIGDGTEARKVLKLGVYYGQKTLCIQAVSMPRAAVGTYAEADLTKGNLTPVLITINQAERTISLDVAGNKLRAEFPKQIRRITHAGYANIRSSQECAPLEIVSPAP